MTQLEAWQLDELCAVAIRRELDRDALLAGVHPLLVASIPLSVNLNDQVFRDLHRLNAHGRLSDESFPLLHWLRNAREREDYTDAERAVFRNALRALGEEPQPQPVSILDMKPYPWSLKRAQRLQEVLAPAYPDPKDARHLAQRCELNVLRIQFDAPPLQVWRDILTVAARDGRLRALVEAALKDPHVAAYHDQIRDLIAPFDPDRAE